MTIPIIAGASGGGRGTPFSFDFEESEQDYMQLSDADFGSFNRNKFSISVWLKPEAIAEISGGQVFILGKKVAGSQLGLQDEFYISVLNDGNTQFQKLSWQCFSSTGAAGSIAMPNNSIQVGVWQNFVFQFDNSLSINDRMRVYKNGNQLTPDSGSNYPNANPIIDRGSASLQLSSDIIPSSSTRYLDGLMHQFSFFDGVLIDPAFAYNSGIPNPDMYNVEGTKSLLENLDNDITYDSALGVDWTNSGVTSSADVP